MSKLTILDSTKQDNDGQWVQKQIDHIIRYPANDTLWVDSAILNSGDEVSVAVGLARNGKRKGKVYHTRVKPDGTVVFEEWKAPKWIAEKTGYYDDIVALAIRGAFETRLAFQGE